MKIFYIGLFGLVGIYLRYFLDSIFIGHLSNIPWSTLIANTFGCLVIGICFSIITHKAPSEFISTIMIGFCGGLTTYSSLNLQVFELFLKSSYLKSLSYLLITLVLGTLAIVLSYQISSRIILK